jgi:hypothetical protein
MQNPLTDLFLPRQFLKNIFSLSFLGTRDVASAQRTLKKRFDSLVTALFCIAESCVPL